MQSSSTATSAAADQPPSHWSLTTVSQPLEQLIHHCYAATQLLDACITPTTSQQLQQQLQLAITDLQALESAARTDCHVSVPLQVIDHLNAGLNPNNVTKNLCLYGTQMNQSVRQKLNNTKVMQNEMQEFERRYKQRTATQMSPQGTTAAPPNG